MDEDFLVSAAMSFDDFYMGSGDTQYGCKEFDTQYVGCAIHRRGGQFDLQGISMYAANHIS